MPVKSAEEAMMLVQYGLNARAVGRTNLNEHSSRSHSILTINIQRASSVDGFTSSVCLGKIHLVDLAGSERLGMSGAVGSQLKETQNINLSLSSLGNVLSALSKFHSDSRTGEASSSRRKPVVPYRDSKLTYLLRDSLGGNSKTIMITNIRSPAAFYQQSKISLMYASRAKNISNSTRVNTDAVGASSMQQLSSQVEILRSKLMERTAEFQRLRGLQVRSSHESKDLKEKLASMAKQNQRERDQLESYLTDVIMNREGKLEKQRKAYEELQESVSEHRDIVAAQRQEITSLRSAVEEGEGEANQLRLALQHAQSDVQRVRNQRDAAGRRLAQESERIRAIVEEWDKQKTELKTRIHELEKERSDTVDSSSSGGIQEAQEAQETIAKHEESIEKLTTVAENQREEIKAMSEAAKATKLENQKLRAELLQRSNENMEQREELEKSVRFLQAAAKEASNLKGELRSERAKVREAQRAHEELSQHRESVEEEQEVLQSRASMAEDRVSQLEAGCATLRQELKDAKSALEKVRNEAANDEGALENAEARRIAAASAAKGAREKLARAEKILEEERLVSKGLRKKLEVLSKEMEKMRDGVRLKLESHSGRLKSLKGEKAELAQKLAEALALLRQSQAAAEASKSEAASANKDKEKVEAELSQLRSASGSNGKKLERSLAKQAQNRAALDKAMSTIEQLKQRMDEQLRARETLKAKVAEDVQKWRKREKALVENAKKVTAEQARWKEMSMKHEAAAHHAADRISELEKAVESFQRDAKTAAESFRKKAEKELASLRRTGSDLRDQLTAMEKKYSDTEDARKLAIAEIRNLKERSRQQLEEVHASGAAATKEAEDAARLAKETAKSSTEKLVSVEQHHREVLMKMEDDMDKLRREMGRELQAAVARAAAAEEKMEAIAQEHSSMVSKLETDHSARSKLEDPGLTLRGPSTFVDAKESGETRWTVR